MTEAQILNTTFGFSTSVIGIQTTIGIDRETDDFNNTVIANAVFNAPNIYTVLVFLFVVTFISTTIALIITWCFTKHVIKRKIKVGMDEILRNIKDDIFTQLTLIDNDNDGYEIVDEVDHDIQDTDTGELTTNSIKGKKRKGKHSTSISKKGDHITLTERHAVRGGHQRAFTPKGSTKSNGHQRASVSRSTARSKEDCTIERSRANTCSARFKSSKKRTGHRYHDLVLNWKRKTPSYDKVIKS